MDQACNLNEIARAIACRQSILTLDNWFGFHNKKFIDTLLELLCLPGIFLFCFLILAPFLCWSVRVLISLILICTQQFTSVKLTQEQYNGMIYACNEKSNQQEKVDKSIVKQNITKSKTIQNGKPKAMPWNMQALVLVESIDIIKAKSTTANYEKDLHFSGYSLTMEEKETDKLYLTLATII